MSGSGNFEVDGAGVEGVVSVRLPRPLRKPEGAVGGFRRCLKRGSGVMEYFGGGEWTWCGSSSSLAALYLRGVVSE